MPALILMILPFGTLQGLVKLLPPWSDTGKAEESVLWE